MFGELLRVGEKVLFQTLIFSTVGAAGPGAGDGADGDDAIAQTHQDFRARPDNGKASEIEEEQKW